MLPLRCVLPIVALVLSTPQDLLNVASAPAGPGPPPGWTVRSVRGQRPPDVEIRRGSDGPVLHIEGAGRAAWFYHELSPEIGESPGLLHWSWRVLAAPPSADLRLEPRDDSPLRVFVVFGRPGFFRRSARIIFYTFGNGEPSPFERASFVSDRLHVVRVDGAAERAAWREHAVDPFADYRRIWKQPPPPVTAVGVMQDTDQTREQAAAEIRRLEWVPSAP